MRSSVSSMVAAALARAHTFCGSETSVSLLPSYQPRRFMSPVTRKARRSGRRTVSWRVVRTVIVLAAARARARVGGLDRERLGLSQVIAHALDDLVAALLLRFRCRGFSRAAGDKHAREACGKRDAGSCADAPWECVHAGSSSWPSESQDGLFPSRFEEARDSDGGRRGRSTSSADRRAWRRTRTPTDRADAGLARWHPQSRGADDIEFDFSDIPAFAEILRGAGILNAMAAIERRAGKCAGAGYHGPCRCRDLGGFAICLMRKRRPLIGGQ